MLLQTGVTVRNCPIWVKIRDFPVWPTKIWWRTLKNNRAPLLYYVKLCLSFQSHWRIQTWVTVRKPYIWVKIGHFCLVWPWNLMDDLEKQQGTYSMLHQALGIISKPLVNSNFSYSPETLNSGQNQQFFVPCGLEIWWMTLKNNRASLLCCFKLVCRFTPISVFKLESQSRNAQFGSKSTIF